RLTPGTKLAILPSPASELSEARGYLEVVSVENFSSKVRPVGLAEKPAISIDDLPPNAYARLSELAVDYKLKVARPTAAPGLEEDARTVDAVLDELSADEDRRFNIEFVEPGAEADLRL